MSKAIPEISASSLTTISGLAALGFMKFKVGIDMAKTQMQSEKYSRMVVYLNLPEESEETFAFLTTIREVIWQYYEGDYYVVGNSTSSRDLSSSFATDNLVISLLSAFFVIVVLLFTFQSAGLPILLIVVIQGSIWINFSIPTLTNTPLYFLGYLIVNALQMGANIDYAIVISSHYQEYKAHMPHKEAIVHAVNAAFPTIFTSGSMMAAAGLLIGNMSAQPVKADIFFRLEDLPEMLRRVTLTFRYGNDMERTFAVDFGTSFPEAWIPPIPPKEDRQSYWMGLEEADLSSVFFDMTFEQAYTSQTTVLESQPAGNEIPVLLVQGIFSEKAVPHVEAAEEPPPLQGREHLLEVWQFRTSEPEKQTRIRLQLPDEADAEQIRILIRSADGSWRTQAHQLSGRYAVAELLPGDDAVALVEAERISPIFLLVILAGIAAPTGLFFIRRRRTKA